MKRMMHAAVLDLRLQWRYRLTAVSLVIGLIAGLALRQFFTPDQQVTVLPAYFLLVVGGTALLYTAAQFMFERDEGTLAALRVSPLRPAEYLTARTLALTLLMLLESAVVLAAGGYRGTDGLWLLLGGLIGLAVLHVLIGMMLIPAYSTLTDALLPITAVVLLLQLPALLLFPTMPRLPLLLLPSAGPLLVLQAAARPTPATDVLLAGGLTLGWCAAAAWAALRRFQRAVIDSD
jgi:hypothetical protein